MIRTFFVFVFGVVTGLAFAYIIEQRPVDWVEVREDAGATLQQARRGARDLSVEASVRTALTLQKDFNLFGGIGVNAEQGVVTLTGTVGSQEQRVLAERIAEGIDGVERVINEIEVHRGG
jgi:osmotically-inducible protein OsmY